MKKFIKWTGIVILSLTIILLLSSWILVKKFDKKFNQVYQITPASIEIPTDSASLERGAILAVSCRSCHDTDLGGKLFFDEPTIGKLPSSNLTKAPGSETEGYTTEDYVRAIKHGLNKSGNPLMVMPSESYTYLSDKDLGCLIAYIQSKKPVDRILGERKFNYSAKVMAALGLFGNLFPYDIIDHEKAMQKYEAPPVSDQVNYGAYLVRISGCDVCHGKNLGGGTSPDPVSPPVPNITKSGNFGKWTLEQFIMTLRSGKTPEGKILDNKFMPFEGISAHNDEELTSLYTYIASLPPATQREK